MKKIVLCILALGVWGTVFGMEDAGESGGKFAYSIYADVLKSYVDERGMVNYRKLKANRSGLDEFVRAMGEVGAREFVEWSSKERLAFWINAYNALTLKVIIDNYPIKASFFKSYAYPKNSIRQISGVWKKIKFKVMGRQVTLERIEHGILRKEFKEPRIHMAMVCAAMGCPPLRIEPYLPDKIDEQLDDQSRRFLANRRKFRIGGDTVYLSPIFKWFGGDFVQKYGSGKYFGEYNKTEGAVLGFVASYVNAKQRQSLISKGRRGISYLDYDWSLNEQK